MSFQRKFQFRLANGRFSLFSFRHERPLSKTLTVSFGSDAGSQVFVKLPLKAKTLILLPD
jgi:hypothetical protein